MTNLRDKIAEVISTGARWRDKAEYVLADAILALPEAKGGTALEGATQALADSEERIEELEAKLAKRPKDIASTTTAELVKRVEELQKKLAEVEAERDQREKSMFTYRDWWIASDARAEAAEAAIPRAWQMGLDAALSEACWADIAVNTTVEVVTVEAIRAIQPPADLVERVKGGE